VIVPLPPTFQTVVVLLGVTLVSLPRMVMFADSLLTLVSSPTISTLIRKSLPTMPAASGTVQLKVYGEVTPMALVWMMLPAGYELPPSVE
jgi:hypothetical protein